MLPLQTDKVILPFQTYGSKVLPLFLDTAGVHLLDQNQLPGNVSYVVIDTVAAMAEAIETMIVRGAPAIGIAAAYGLILGLRVFQRQGNADLMAYQAQFQQDKARLEATRPTAVNLSWALTQMTRAFEAYCAQPNLTTGENPLALLEKHLTQKATTIQQADIDACKAMGDYGAVLVPRGAGVLTHCNAGGLATGAYGTALGVIRSAYANDATIQVFADETRPRFQGARLTTWELVQDKIPVTLITDSMAASLMAAGKIQCVVVGADRITRNGDVANKIGTYGVAVLAHAHNIPFYVAAPESTFDMTLATGAEIPIEYRSDDEIKIINGGAVAADGAQFLNPGFDVTPARYITAIITEYGVIQPDYLENIPRVLTW